MVVYMNIDPDAIHIAQVAAAASVGWHINEWTFNNVCESLGERADLVALVRAGVVEHMQNGLRLADAHRDEDIRARFVEATADSADASTFGRRCREWFLFERHIYFG